MNKIIKILPGLIFLIVLSFVMFAKADYLDEDDALLIGEEKYLEFLWLVDGAFNNLKFNSEFTVNGKKLRDDKKIFTCKYRNNTSCIGNNFEDEFAKVFASNISYNKVYGDGVLYTWIKYDNGKYIFDNLNNCSTYRMDTNQSIELYDIKENQLLFYAGGEKDVYRKNQMFILIKENGDWKVSVAHYRDICEMDYNIE